LTQQSGPWYQIWQQLAKIPTGSWVDKNKKITEFSEVVKLTIALVLFTTMLWKGKLSAVNCKLQRQ
jgi:hypothetical protein